MIYWRTLASNLADGYTYASEQISSRLKDVEVVNLEDISLVGSNILTISVSDKYGIRFIPEVDHAKVIINNCLPPDYSYDADYVIGFTYWETTRLPADWVEKMNECDEVWTASKWAKQVFIDSGVTVPVYSFDLGVDTDTFRYSFREYGEPFTFIHVGSPSTRKNTQLVVDAFLNLFDGDNRYKLILKSKGPPDARRFVNGVNMGGLYNYDQIEIIDHYLTDEELAKLFNRSNCFVYPTRGEGWGMAPFQAIATGLPTICTNATACQEFASLSVPLEAEYGSTNQFGIYENGYWADPKLSDLCDRMLYVVRNYSEALDKTWFGSWCIRDNYSWGQVAMKFRERIMELPI
jgi:glycosyltransferase involved in cell wall biosynthesis